MTIMTITGNMRSFLETLNPYGDDANTLEFFIASHATEALPTQITAHSDTPPGYEWLGYTDEEAMNFPTIVLNGTFTYGNLGTVDGLATSMTISYNGQDLVRISDFEIDAQSAWGSLITQSVSDFLPVFFSGADQLIGAGTNDSFRGFKGKDVLRGNGGSDDLQGGAGSDKLFGGSGSDTLQGGAGGDRLFGGNGSDRLEGGKGNDFLNGGSGRDILEGGVGNDTLVGGGGIDEFRFYYETGLGDDTIEDWSPDEVIQIIGAESMDNLTIRQSNTDVEVYFLNNSVSILDTSIDEVINQIQF